jgi:hypothetical protein
LKTKALLFSALICLLSLAGCRSRGISVTITNTGDQPTHNLELDYPGGSFGTPAIQPNTPFHYRMKITREGQMKLLFVESNGREHHENGPNVHAGDDGNLTVAIDRDGNNTWQADVQRK